MSGEPTADLVAESVRLAELWRLTRTAEPRAGHASLVSAVTTEDGTPAMLKLSRAEPDAVGELPALKAWAGRGAVRVLRADPHRGALLLERLGEDLSAVDPLEACRITGALYRFLHRPADPRLPELATSLERWLGDLAAAGQRFPAPGRFVEQALAAAPRLLADAPRRIIHGDLHYGNVLHRSTTNEWVAIDPKGFNGDPAYELAPMLWNRWGEIVASANAGEAVRERFYALLDASGLDELRCRDWVVVRSMISILWKLESTSATKPRRDWITACVTTAKAMQDIGF